MDCKCVSARYATSAMLLCSVALFLATSLSAQLGTGTILGVVKDTTGGVVAGAAVMVRNPDTGFSRTVSTETDGSYRLSALAVGRYDIEISHAGFNTETRKSLALAVAQEAVVNVTLQVGSASQTVTVTETAPLVDTTSASLGGVVTPEKIEDLPLNGRNYLDLMGFQPGVTNVTHVQGNLTDTGGAEYVSNGATPRSNSILLDGAVLVNGFGLNSASVSGSSLGTDGIKEFKVITNLFSAEYGLTMGSQTVMVSKSGTNQFHGDAFYFARNSVFDAKNPFDVGSKPGFDRNQFGGAFGGPIKKDKTFFFAAYEGLIQNLGLTNTSETNIPEAGCRGPAGTVVWNGNGLRPVGAAGPCPQLGFDPQNTGLPIPPNFVTISPVTAGLLKIVPLPNFQVGQGIDPNTGQATGDIFTYPHAQPTNENYGQIRVDQIFSSKDSFFVRYTIDNTIQNTPGAFPGILTANSGRAQFLTLSESHIFSPTVVNNARFSFTRATLQNISTASVNTPGLPDYSNAALGAFPMVSTGQPFVGGFGAPGWSDGPGFPFQSQDQNIYTLSDDVFWTRGKHSFKFGTMLNHYTQPMDLEIFKNGTFSSGSVADFLQGNVNSFAITPPAANTNRDFLYNTYGFYGQDDIRLLRRLTVNLGLRYEFRGPIGELQGNTKTYAFLNFPQDTGSCIGSFIPGCMTNPPAGTTNGRITQNPTLHNFSPRIGLAWDPFGNGKTAVRAGFGIYYDLANIGAALGNDLFATPPTSFQNTQFGIQTQALCLPLDTCYPVPTPQSAPLWPWPYSGATLSTIDYHAKQPYMYQYNLSVQRQLPWGMTVNVAYVGSRGIHLWSIQEGNPAVPDQMLDPQNPLCGTAGAPPNCTAAGVAPPSNTPGGITWINSNCPFPPPAPPAFINPVSTGNPNACRMNPYYGDYTINTTHGDSWYNSLQVGLQKQLSNGLDFQISYTYSQMLDTTQGQIPGADAPSADSTDPYNPRFDKGTSEYDIPQQFIANVIYYIPNLSKSQGFMGKLADGWWISNIVAFSSGEPFAPTAPGGAFSNSQNTYGGNDRLDYVTAANLAAAQALDPLATPYVRSKATPGTVAEWFNPHMFTPQPFGTLGDVGRGILRGQRTANWNFSLAKDTKIGKLGEAGKLTLRADFFNLLNHPVFDLPNAQVIGFGGPNATAGSIQNSPSNSQRQIQFGARVEF